MDSCTDKEGQYGGLLGNKRREGVLGALLWFQFEETLGCAESVPGDFHAMKVQSQPLWICLSYH